MNSEKVSLYSTYTLLLHCCVFCSVVAEEVKMSYMGEVGSEEFLMKLTTQITEMVSAKMTQGEERRVLLYYVYYTFLNRPYRNYNEEVYLGPKYNKTTKVYLTICCAPV